MPQSAVEAGNYKKFIIVHKVGWYLVHSTADRIHCEWRLKIYFWAKKFYGVIDPSFVNGFWGMFHTPLRICKLWIFNYSQILTGYFHINGENSINYCQMVVDNKEKVLWNRPNWLPWSQILVNHATLVFGVWSQASVTSLDNSWKFLMTIFHAEVWLFGLFKKTSNFKEKLLCLYTFCANFGWIWTTF